MIPTDAYRLAIAHQERLLHDADPGRVKFKLKTPKPPLLLLIKFYLNRIRKYWERVETLMFVEQSEVER